jgi:two-component sensor histidine kinase
LVAKAYDIEPVVETAVLLVSELTTNVTKHVRGANHAKFQIVASRCGERVRVEVHDASSQFPVMRHPTTLAEDGRGLCLVRELAYDHGAYSLPSGKSTWFELVAWPDDIDDYVG